MKKQKKDKTAQGHRASKAKAPSSPALSKVMLQRRLQEDTCIMSPNASEIVTNTYYNWC